MRDSKRPLKLKLAFLMKTKFFTHMAHSVHINLPKIFCVLTNEVNSRHMLHIIVDNSPPPTKKRD